MKEKNYNKANNIMPHEMVKSLMGEVSKEEKDLVTLQWDNMMKKLNVSKKKMTIATLMTILMIRASSGSLS